MPIDDPASFDAAMAAPELDLSARRRLVAAAGRRSVRRIPREACLEVLTRPDLDAADLALLVFMCPAYAYEVAAAAVAHPAGGPWLAAALDAAAHPSARSAEVRAVLSASLVGRALVALWDPQFVSLCDLLAYAEQLAAAGEEAVDLVAGFAPDWQGPAEELVATALALNTRP